MDGMVWWHGWQLQLDLKGLVRRRQHNDDERLQSFVSIWILSIYPGTSNANCNTLKKQILIIAEVYTEYRYLQKLISLIDSRKFDFCVHRKASKN